MSLCLATSWSLSSDCSATKAKVCPPKRETALTGIRTPVVSSQITRDRTNWSSFSLPLEFGKTALAKTACAATSTCGAMKLISPVSKGWSLLGLMISTLSPFCSRSACSIGIRKLRSKMLFWLMAAISSPARRYSPSSTRMSPIVPLIGDKTRVSLRSSLITATWDWALLRAERSSSRRDRAASTCFCAASSWERADSWSRCTRSSCCWACAPSETKNWVRSYSSCCRLTSDWALLTSAWADASSAWAVRMAERADSTSAWARFNSASLRSGLNCAMGVPTLTRSPDSTKRRVIRPAVSGRKITRSFASKLPINWELSIKVSACSSLSFTGIACDLWDCAAAGGAEFLLSNCCPTQTPPPKMAMTPKAIAPFCQGRLLCSGKAFGSESGDSVALGESAGCDIMFTDILWIGICF